jgi:hypothetical protein
MGTARGSLGLMLKYIWKSDSSVAQVQWCVWIYSIGRKEEKPRMSCSIRRFTCFLDRVQHTGTLLLLVRYLITFSNKTLPIHM